MSIKVVEVDPWQLDDVSDHFKIQEMCDDLVWGDPFPQQYVPDWFVKQQQIKIWLDDDYYCDNDKIIKWYGGYQNARPRKHK